MFTALPRPLGHERITDRLSAEATAVTSGGDNRLAHALVFAGPEGVGKFHVAHWWASRLKCTSPDECEHTPCLECRQVAAGSHPDVTVLAPSEPGKAIGIDEVRALIRTMSLKPLRNGPRVAMVRDAHLLTTHAQSAMLKLLEEPPGFAVLVLVADNLATLLPTIRSRCRIVRFGRLDEDVVCEILEATGTDRTLARSAAMLADGSPGRALCLTAETIADRASLVEAVEELRRGERREVEDLVRDLAERRTQGRPALEALLVWQMKKVEASLGRNERDASEPLERLLAAASDEEAGRLLADAHRTLWAIGALDRNGNPRLVIRELLLDVRDR